MWVARILVIIILFSSSFNVNGQAEPRVGLKVGLNRTLGVAHGSGFNYDRVDGISIGFYRDFKLGRSVGLESGLIIDAYKTTYFAFSFSGRILGGKDKFTYLSFPLIPQFQLGKHLNFNTGPQFGLLLSAKAESDDQEVDVKEYTKGSMFSWTVGLEFNGNPFDVGIRYLFGITDINDAKDVIDVSYRLNTLQIYLGINFSKAKSSD